MSSLRLAQHDLGWTSAMEQPVSWETHQKDDSPPKTTFVGWVLRDALGLGLLWLGAAPSGAMSWWQWGRLPPIAQPMGLEAVSCAVAVPPLQHAGV